MPHIYTNLGIDYDERVLPSITNEVLKAVVAQFDAGELITQREMLSARVRYDDNDDYDELDDYNDAMDVDIDDNEDDELDDDIDNNDDARSDLVARAEQFGLILDDIAITHLTFGREFTQAVELKQV